MALDYRLPAQAAEPSGFSPLKALANADAFVAQKDKQREAQAEAAREQMIGQVVQQHPGDPDAAIAYLEPRDWKAAASLRKLIVEQRTNLAKQRSAEIDNDVKLGKMKADEAEAERKALASDKLEEWVDWFEKDPPRAAKAARFLLGPEKLAQLEGQAEARAITMRGQDMTSATAEANRGVTMRGQDISADTARSGQAVTMRGQDIGASTTRRGQDLTAGTAAARLAADKAAGGAGGAKLGVAAIEKIAGVDQAMGMMDDIERLFPKMDSAIGPVDAWRTWAKLKSGVNVTPELAEFASQVAGLKNAVIKATTGAAMSEPEAKRIMEQVPDLSNPPAVFKARIATTRKNLETLKRRTIELSGGTVPATQAAPPPSGNKPADPLGIR